MATITEVSVSFALTRAPKAPIHDRVPYMVDPRYAYTERAIQGLVEDVPEWVDDPKTNNLKFEYVLPSQRIECVYHKKKCILTCFKIRYCNYSSFLEESTLFEILDTKQNGIVNTKYKAVGTLASHKPWNKNIFADLITNDPRIANDAAMCEKSSTLNERRMVSMTVRGNSRITIAEGPPGKTVAMMSKLSDTEEPAMIMSALREIFDIYDDRYEELTAVYVDERRTVREARAHPAVPLTGIKLLRSNLPELFVNNYTRECPMLPIMISQEEADNASVICYPKDGVHRRYYTAPEGYYVGLKKNRLKNKDLFPYLVTCYLSDHMTREGSETHKYYFGGEIKSKTKSNRPIPKFITNKNAGYHRKRADPPSFVAALERATGRAIDRSNMPWCPQVTKQELWDKKDDDIMDAILSADDNVCGSSVYRYFENLLNVSIHVVVIANGTFDNVLPRHKGTYVWSAPHPRHVILFENYKTTYGVTSCYYDILVGRDDDGVFEDDDPIASSLVEEKKSMSVPPMDIEDVAHQLIDGKGKCRLVVKHDGSSVETYTRPFDVPTIAEPTCFFDEHVRKLNVAKVRMGLPVIDLSKRSTEIIKHHGWIAGMPDDYAHYVDLMASYVNGHIVPPAMNPEECVTCATTFEYEIAVNDVKLCTVPAMTDGGFFIIQGAKKVLMIQETRLKSEPFVTLAPPCCELFVQNAVVPVRIQIVDDSVIELDTKMIHKDLRDIPSIGLFEVLMYMFLSHMKNTTEKFEHIVYLLQSYCTQQDYADICLTYVIASSTGIGGLSILEDKEIIRAKLLGGMSDTNVVATLVQMVALCVGAKFGITKPSDRDDYAIKCLRTPGNIVYSLFKQCIHPEQKNLQNAINRKIYSCIRRGELKVAGRVQAKLAVQLSDRSDIDVLSSVRKVVVPCDPNSSNMQMRQIHRTQRGYICPCETPEGKTVGLNKSLACSCLISVETDVSDWIRTHCRQKPFKGSVWVIVDGAVVGWTAKASQDVLDLKRAYPTASFVILDNVLKVRTCGGRPLQPLLVVPFDWNDVGRPSANREETNAIPRLLSNGLLHYVDPFERAHNKVASLDYQCDLESFRYMELDPSMMLGLAASMIPFPEHNQSARNVFASSMVKQAMQMKGSGTTCNYLQKPIVYTNVSRAVGYDNNPNGINLVTCIMSLEGYNQEDAILFKKSCVDRGLFDSIVRSSTSTVVSNPWHLVKIDGKLFVLSGGTEKSLLEIAPMLSQPKVVDTKEVLLDSGKSHISVTIEEHRHLSPGDKFASRHAQKGVVGRIMNEADMPFTEQGITPDIIINPHAIPSRMTVGQLIEGVLGKAGCITGDFVDGTPFLGRDIHDILKMKDTETMMLGTTGELIETPIAIGVVYYMALKHQAADKVYVRSSGTKSLMSRQPISGRSKGGGLRFGEMEYDTLIAHGAYKIITKISEHSDMIDVPYCTECSLVTDSKKCPSCDSNTVVKMMPFSYVVFKDLMLSANVLVQTVL